MITNALAQFPQENAESVTSAVPAVFRSPDPRYFVTGGNLRRFREIADHQIAFGIDVRAYLMGDLASVVTKPNAAIKTG